MENFHVVETPWNPQGAFGVLEGEHVIFAGHDYGYRGQWVGHYHTRRIAEYHARRCEEGERAMSHLRLAGDPRGFLT